MPRARLTVTPTEGAWLFADDTPTSRQLARSAVERDHSESPRTCETCRVAAEGALALSTCREPHRRGVEESPRPYVETRVPSRGSS